MYKGPVKGRILLLTDKRVEDDILNCCAEMAFHAKEKEQIIVYDPITRRLGIKVRGSVVQLISYCPWCSKKLPRELSKEFFGIIFDELNADGQDDPNLPTEFKSDLWWKKRGL
jgi:hypothetical protein